MCEFFLNVKIIQPMIAMRLILFFNCKMFIYRNDNNDRGLIYSVFMLKHIKTYPFQF